MSYGFITRRGGVSAKSGTATPSDGTTITVPDLIGVERAILFVGTVTMENSVVLQIQIDNGTVSHVYAVRDTTDYAQNTTFNSTTGQITLGSSAKFKTVNTYTYIVY